MSCTDYHLMYESDEPVKIARDWSRKKEKGRLLLTKNGFLLTVLYHCWAIEIHYL